MESVKRGRPPTHPRAPPHPTSASYALQQPPGEKSSSSEVIVKNCHLKLGRLAKPQQSIEGKKTKSVPHLLADLIVEHGRRCHVGAYKISSCKRRNNPNAGDKNEGRRN